MISILPGTQFPAIGWSFSLSFVKRSSSFHLCLTFFICATVSLCQQYCIMRKSANQRRRRTSQIFFPMTHTKTLSNRLPSTKIPNFGSSMLLLCLSDESSLVLFISLHVWWLFYLYISFHISYMTNVGNVVFFFLSLSLSTYLLCFSSAVAFLLFRHVLSRLLYFYLYSEVYFHREPML